MTSPNETKAVRETASERGIYEGANVYSREGDRLGRVEEVRGTYLRIRKRLFGGSGYWLDVSHVQTVDGDDVRLDLDKDSVRDHEVPAEVVTDTALDARVDQLLSDEEQEEQRRKLEESMKH